MIQSQNFYGGLHYVKATDKIIKKEPFEWGDKTICSGTILDKIGENKRSRIMLSDAKIEYCGRNDDNWYLYISYINNTTMLVQSASNSFWDIRL